METYIGMIWNDVLAPCLNQPCSLKQPTDFPTPSNPPPHLQDSREGRAVVGVVAALEPQRSEQAELDWQTVSRLGQGMV